MIFTDEKLDLYLVDLGSKAGSFREVGQEYNRDLQQDRRERHLSEEDRAMLIEKKRKRKTERFSIGKSIPKGVQKGGQNHEKRVQNGCWNASAKKQGIWGGPI